MDALSLSIVNPLMVGPWIGGVTVRLAFSPAARSVVVSLTLAHRPSKEHTHGRFIPRENLVQVGHISKSLYMLCVIESFLHRHFK